MIRIQYGGRNWTRIEPPPLDSYFMVKQIDTIIVGGDDVPPLFAPISQY